MPRAPQDGAKLSQLDPATRTLVRLAAVLAAAPEGEVRSQLELAHAEVPHEWVEELLLQTYLFAGFPKALNAMRQWRRLRSMPATTADGTPADVRAAGERTCSLVYGAMYHGLRANIRALHPMLDEWMILEGYGKVLSRPGLDLPRRELCIVAACAASGQDRQLQSHLHGARNSGVGEPAISEALRALEGVVPQPLADRAFHLWNRIRDDIH